MKTIFALILFFTSSATLWSALTRETEAEITVVYDFSGDGDRDLALINKTSGVARMFFSDGDGGLSEGAIFATGLSEVTAASAGEFLGVEQLVLASPGSNRIHLIDPDTPGIQTPLFLAAPGPRSLAVLDVPGTGNTPQTDLVVFSEFGIGGPYYTEVRQSGDVLSVHDQDAVSGLWTQLQAVQIVSGDPEVGALVNNGTDFALLELDSSGTFYSSIGGLGEHTQYQIGSFGSAANHVFLWERGLNQVLSILPNAATYALSASTSHEFSSQIQEFAVIPDDTNDYVVIIFEGGSAGAVYTFEEGSGFTEIDTFTAQSIGGGSLLLNGIVPMEKGIFHVLSGDPGTVASGFTSLDLEDGSLLETASLTFSEVPVSGDLANVFIYQNEPFVDADAKLIQNLQQLDWTSDVVVSGTIEVQGEVLGDEQAGLIDGQTYSLGVAPSGATHGLGNQISDQISLFALDQPVGLVVESLSIDPEGGTFDSAISVSFNRRDPTTQVYFRVNGGSFSADPGDLTLFEDAFVEFYGVTALFKTTPLYSATFTFSLPPEKQDFDSDSLPDFVEIHAETFAVPGSDFDEDGFGDYVEMISVTDPSDGSSFPAGNPSSAAIMELKVTPVPYDGALASEAYAVEGVNLRAYDGLGATLAFTTTSKANFANATGEFLVPFDPTYIFGIVATEEHFDIETAHSDPSIGRELAGVFQFDEIVPVMNPYVYDSNDTLANNVKQWLETADLYYSPAPPVVVQDLDRIETLKLLLFECVLTQAFVERGEVFPLPLSLTAFRTGEGAVYSSPSFEQLYGLEQPLLDSINNPAYKLDDLYRAVANQVESLSPSPGMVALKDLVTDIYKISSYENNTNPGLYGLPIDVLRGFINTGSLMAPYDVDTVLTVGALSDARAEIAVIKAAVATRPVFTEVLQVPEEGADRLVNFESCTLLETEDGLATYSLLTPQGNPYPIPDEFELIEGARFWVEGFIDVPDHCGESAVEVVSIELLHIPTPTEGDDSGNVLPDAWEGLFFGGVGLVDTFADTDGSGYSALQQFLEGTDPTDFSSVPLIQPLDLSLIDIDIELVNGPTLRLFWNWGVDAYAPSVLFKLEDSADLSGFDPGLENGVYLGAGDYEIEFPMPSAERFFYRVGLTLAP